MRCPALACLLATVLPAALPAQIVRECDWVGNPANIMEPWDAFSRSFAGGVIRIAQLDTGGEPVCCATHLLVLAPSEGGNGPIYRQCFVVSDKDGAGFYDIDFPGIMASELPGPGLRLDVPVSRYHDRVGLGEPGVPDRITIRIDPPTGSVALE